MDRPSPPARSARGATDPIALLAIDLDGTLLDVQGELTERNRAALHTAHERGIRLVLCTGRSYTETRPILDAIGLDLDAAVTVNGSLLTDVRSGATLESYPMGFDLAEECIDFFQQRDYTVLWLHDARVHGFDGYVLSGPRRHDAIERWMQKTPCVMYEVRELPAERPPALRLTIVDDSERLERVSADFGRVFHGRMTHNLIEVPLYAFTIIETFVSPIDKWFGIRRLCERFGVDPRRTAAIGDDVNDLAMIRAAGLGVAIGNARAEVLAAAQVRVASNSDSGVAELIDRILDGELAPRATMAES